MQLFRRQGEPYDKGENVTISLLLFFRVISRVEVAPGKRTDMRTAYGTRSVTLC